MKFDPKAAPFWEQKRGFGPISERLRKNDELAEARQKRDAAENAAILRVRVKKLGESATP